MLIDWIRCDSYDDAKNYSHVLYLHEWHEKPFYWGKADNSFFGGHKRKYDGLHATGRYNSGYRHWIEGCLRHGAKLYIGRLDNMARTRIDDLENYLIATFGHVMNTKVDTVAADLVVEHIGSVPGSIRNHASQQQLGFQYFAYGSNMLTRRLTSADRAPSAKPAGIGYVIGRRLTFDKVSSDGSGKCDAQTTGTTTDRVYGVVFQIALADKVALDKAEGLDKGYAEERIDVVTAKGILQLDTYIATKKDPHLLPYHWYKAITVAGAVEHQLPMHYVEWLRAFESIEDPDVKRRAENEALLFVN